MNTFASSIEKKKRKISARNLEICEQQFSFYYIHIRSMYSVLLY